MSAPAVVIQLIFENDKPLVYADVITEGEQLRLDDWIRHHPRLLDLVRQATELGREERAA